MGLFISSLLWAEVEIGLCCLVFLPGGCLFVLCGDCTVKGRD